MVEKNATLNYPIAPAAGQVYLLRKLLVLWKMNKNPAFRRILLFIALVLLCVLHCNGASTWPPLEVEQLVEDLVESGENEGTAEVLLEELSRIWQHPVNLRGKSIAQLCRLPLIAPGEAERIAQFLQENPEVQAVEALGIVLQMPPARRKLFAMFYTLYSDFLRLDSTLRRQIRGDVVQRFGYRVPLFTADPDRMKKVYSSAVGTPLSLLVRATITADDRLSIGLKGAKRSGEPFFYSHAPQGFLYYSAFVHLQGKFYSSPHIVIGDFTANFGTGQTVGSRPTLIRIHNPYMWGRQGSGLRGQLGICDNSTLRGVGLQHQPLPWLSYAVALSAQPLTTSLANAKRQRREIGRIASIISYPIYTKPREADRHFNTWEFCAIVNLQAIVGPLSLGYTSIATHYNRDFVNYNSASFRLPHPAQTAMRNGLAAHLYLKSWTLWGEITLSSPLRGEQRGHAVSSNIGITYTPSYNLSIGLQSYYYPYNASPRYAQGVISTPQNRTGAVANIMLRVANAAEIQIGAEAVHYINPKVIRRTPALTWRGFAEVQYTLAQGSILDARYRYYEYQQVRSPKTYKTASLAKIHAARLRGEFRQGDWLSLRTSILYAYRDGKGKSTGYHNWATAQDIRIIWLRGRLKLTCRGAIYNCLGEGVILALYENAPLYSMSISRFMKRGWRACGMIHWEFLRGISATYKAATTQLFRESLEELTELARQRRNMLEMTLQLRWRF